MNSAEIGMNSVETGNGNEYDGKKIEIENRGENGIAIIVNRMAFAPSFCRPAVSLGIAFIYFSHQEYFNL